jgi:hypothetical protein
MCVNDRQNHGDAFFAITLHYSGIGGLFVLAAYTGLGGDTMHDVGTNKIFENEKVIVWELFLEASEHYGRHTHELPYVIYVMQGSTLKAFDADGNEAASVVVKSGEVLPFRIEGGDFVSGSGDEEIRVPATHSVQNVGEAPYKEILIEFKP